MHALGMLIYLATVLHVTLAQVIYSDQTAVNDELSKVFAQVPLCAVSFPFLPGLISINIFTAKLQFANASTRPVPVIRPQKLPLYERYPAI